MDSGTMENSCTGKLAGDRMGHRQATGINNVLLQRTAAYSRKDSQLAKADYHRLLVDLQKAVCKRDSVIENLKNENDRLSKNCRIQRKLIKYLRLQLSQLQALPKPDMAVKQAVHGVPGSAVAGYERKEQRRVVSLDGALLRIRGEEINDAGTVSEDVTDIADLDEIDLAEFQPIAEFETQPLFVDRLSSRAMQLADLIRNTAGTFQETVTRLNAAVRSLPWLSYKMTAYATLKSCLSQLRQGISAIRVYQHRLCSNYLQKTK